MVSVGRPVKLKTKSPTVQRPPYPDVNVLRTAHTFFEIIVLEIVWEGFKDVFSGVFVYSGCTRVCTRV